MVKRVVETEVRANRDLVAVCGAKTRDGDPCKLPPMRGATRCRMHGAASPAGRQKASERLLMAKLRGEVQRMGWEPVTNPALLLADLAGEARAFKDMAREKLNELETWENHNQFGAEEVKAVVAVYVQAMRDVSAIADKMWSRGLDTKMLQAEAERPTREQAQAFSRVLDRVFRELGLTDEQQERAPAVLADALRAEGLI